LDFSITRSANPTVSLPDQFFRSRRSNKPSVAN
jgi:hypothetical protein